MLQVEYKRDMYKNYLIIKEDAIKDRESYEMKMVTNNQIQGLLKVESRTVDYTKEYCYDITGKQPMTVLFRKESLKEKQIRIILSKIINVLKKGREYLLLENNFVICPEYIYINLENLEPELIYFSNYKKSITEQILQLIEYMMDKVDYKDKEAVFLIYGIYKITREENVTFEKFLELLQEGKKLEEEIGNKEKEEQELWQEEEKVMDMEVPVESEEEKKKYPLWVFVGCGMSVVIALVLIVVLVRSGILFDIVTGKLLIGKMAAVLGVIGALEAYVLLRFLDEKNQITYIDTKTDYIKPVEEKRRWENQELKEKEKSILFPQKDDNSNETEHATVVLAEKEDCYFLEPSKPELYFPISFLEFPFFIGTLKTKVDCIINSRSVSRFHAKFEREGERFYLVDLNSTNGTFLNGVRLDTNERKEIVVGDYVAFADVVYQFRKQ